MISKFDTYSEIMPDYCMDYPARYSKCTQFQDMRVGFFAWIFKNLMESYPDLYICYRAILNYDFYKIWEKSNNYFYVFYQNICPSEFYILLSQQ